VLFDTPGTGPPWCTALTGRIPLVLPVSEMDGALDLGGGSIVGR